MKQNSFFEMFLDLIRDLFDAENQIVESLPKLIKAASHTELKVALSDHLEETKGQVQRLKKIFKMLNENPTGVKCPAMQGLIEETEEDMAKSTTPSVKDASIIICCQKIEHYEISSYGSARTLAKHLNEASVKGGVDFDEIADLLQATLDEESSADEKLTDLAEGGFFTQGINEEAESESQGTKRRKEL
ncbi:MAG: ferritin-like domain-containing protein [Candidatus Protochlamydia sp.]|nr:ferritin-like domain-containing protein [Candidatus Protochlamydia sp.]